MKDIYGYLTGCLILLSILSVLFYLRKDLRKDILWSGCFGMITALTAAWWVPTYWNPPTILGLNGYFGFDLEDFLLMFAIGGISSVIYEYIFNRKLHKNIKKIHPHLTAIFIFFILYGGLQLLFPDKVFYNSIVAFFAGIVLIMIQRHDLVFKILISGIFFGVLYFIMFKILIFLFPYYIGKYYSFQNLSGLFMFKVPIEEVVLGFFMGAFWSALYEYRKGYELIKS